MWGLLPFYKVSKDVSKLSTHGGSTNFSRMGHMLSRSAGWGSACTMPCRLTLQVTERECLCGVGGQKVRNKPQATRLTRSLGRTNFTINMTGRVEFVRCIASAADERKLRKTLPAIPDTGLNAPKRKEHKKQKNVSSPMKKMKEMPETACENMWACHHYIK